MSIHVRKTASGSNVYDVRLRTPDGRLYKRTFRTRKEADTFEAREKADRSRGGWVDPRAGQLQLAQYAARWLTQRPALRPRTVELYESLLRRHILPELGRIELSALTTATVRAWHARLLLVGARPGPSTVAKCYRLLRTILSTAVEDELIVKNPCILKGAGVERPEERSVATLAQVHALAEAVDPRWRVMILLATFTGLRLGELAGLTRRHVDLLHGTVKVVQQVQELNDGSRVVVPPKTEAGRRTVAIPPHLLADLEAHLAAWAEPGTDGLLFPSPEGGPIRRSNFSRRVWQPACRAVGIEGMRFHDLRHTGNTLAAATGASTRELMARMGHASPRAALIYQHATADRDAAIARALSDLVTAQKPAVVLHLDVGD